MRVLTLFFLVVLSSSAFAGVVCIRQNDNSWVCSGDGGGGSEYPPGVVITNGLGYCTNCVNMTPQRCEKIKSQFLDSLYEIDFSLRDNLGQIDDVEKEITEFRSYWDQMQVNTYNSASVPPDYVTDESGSALVYWQKDQIQSGFVVNSVPTSILNGTSRGAGLNSIANYYQSVVAPVLNSVLNSLGSIRMNVNSSRSYVYSLTDTANSLNCSTCEFSAVPDDGDDSGGGSGGGSSGGCPCTEQMQALADVVAQQKIIVESCSHSLTNLESNVDKLYQAFDTYRVSVTNSLSRIDSFVTSDLANSMRQLTNSLVVIERNVDGVQRDFYQAMSNAQYFVSLGDKEWDPVEISTNFFEVGEYKDLPWASRVEALLLNLTKPFDSSSTPDGVTKETMDEVVEKVSELQSAVDPASLSSAYSTQFDKVQRAFSSFNGLFQGDSTGTLNFGKIGDHDLTFQLDASVVGVCRTVFSLIWYCTALVALFFIVPFLWSLSLGSFKFLWHLLTLLVK